MLPTGFRTFHFVSFLYVFSFLFFFFCFVSFLTILFSFFCVSFFCVSFRYFSPCFLFVFFLSVSFRFFSFFFRFSVYRYPLKSDVLKIWLCSLHFSYFLLRGLFIDVYNFQIIPTLSYIYIYFNNQCALNLILCK